MINTLENFSKFNLKIVAYKEDDILNEFILEDLHKIGKVSIFEIYNKYKDDKFIIDLIKNMRLATILYYNDRNINKVVTVSNSRSMNTSIFNFNKTLILNSDESPMNFEEDIHNACKFINSIDISTSCTLLLNKHKSNIDYLKLLNNFLNVDIHCFYKLNINQQFIKNVENFYNPKINNNE